MAYKYESILKTFEYSKDSYKIISDFLLSGDITNPNILLKVNELTKAFKPSAKPLDWFRITSTKAYISALINVQLEDRNKKLETTIYKWIKDNNIDKTIFSSEVVNNHLTLNLELLTKSEDSKLMKLLKDIGLVSIKKGNLKGS